MDSSSAIVMLEGVRPQRSDVVYGRVRGATDALEGGGGCGKGCRTDDDVDSVSVDDVCED